jgi:hypothetical protein
MITTAEPQAGALVGENGLDALRVVLSESAHRLFRAELALHDARATHVDSWICAASDRLHEAVLAHYAAIAAYECRCAAPQCDTDLAM